MHQWHEITIKKQVENHKLQGFGVLLQLAVHFDQAWQEDDYYMTRMPFPKQHYVIGLTDEFISHGKTMDLFQTSETQTKKQISPLSLIPSVPDYNVQQDSES